MVKRQPSSQAITWFLDLVKTNQLDLDPPYQRKSVWTSKDRQYFLDTIFKNFPCPAIFIHKETDEKGKTTYHVIDGKQRLQTILRFSNNEISVAKNFGDVNFDGKKFNELSGEQKRKFWDYVLFVDFIDDSSTFLINEIFDRLNRNSKNLTEQELRHAKYEGWFITEVEKESENLFWQKVKVSTTAKAKRMKDTQFISELLMIVLENKIVGFDQDHISDIYSKYENPTEHQFDLEDYLEKKEKIRKYIEVMEDEHNAITNWPTTGNNFYTLWALIALTVDLPEPKNLAIKYNLFMEKVGKMNEDIDFETLVSKQEKLAYTYYINSRGASTDLKQRNERLSTLKE